MKKNITLKQNEDRFVHAIFCDDIRHELGNKVSFMGCYQGEMFVPSIPIVLPKLCVYVTITSAITKPLKSLKIRLQQGATVLATMDVPEIDVSKVTSQMPKDTVRTQMSAGLMLSPFAINEPNEVRVFVTTEDGEMIGPRLRIKATPQIEDLVSSPNVETVKATPKKTGTRKTRIVPKLAQ